MKKLNVLNLSERTRVSLVLILAASFMMIDLISDYLEGESAKHIILEGSILLTVVITLTQVSRVAERLSQKLKSTDALLKDAQFDALCWREEASTYLAGLGAAIDQQFVRWSLTAAEKEVGLMILKGLSYKEIASYRETTERTIRSQSLSIFAKSGLSGRAELSAFFLEDLLLPIQKKEISKLYQPVAPVSQMT